MHTFLLVKVEVTFYVSFDTRITERNVHARDGLMCKKKQNDSYVDCVMELKNKKIIISWYNIDN